jgi:rubredoxin
LKYIVKMEIKVGIEADSPTEAKSKLFEEIKKPLGKILGKYSFKLDADLVCPACGSTKVYILSYEKSTYKCNVCKHSFCESKLPNSPKPNISPPLQFPNGMRINHNDIRWLRVCELEEMRRKPNGGKIATA